jgi:hypothetical protein
MTEPRSTRVAFDQSYYPPAPVLPVGIGGIDDGSPTTMLRMLVDTGADCTLIPVDVARALRLPMVDKVRARGASADRGHARRRALDGVRR